MDPLSGEDTVAEVALDSAMSISVSKTPTTVASKDQPGETSPKKESLDPHSGEDSLHGQKIHYTFWIFGILLTSQHLMVSCVALGIRRMKFCSYAPPYSSHIFNAVKFWGRCHSKKRAESERTPHRLLLPPR